MLKYLVAFIAAVLFASFFATTTEACPMQRRNHYRADCQPQLQRIYRPRTYAPRQRAYVAPRVYYAPRIHRRAVMPMPVLVGVKKYCHPLGWTSWQLLIGPGDPAIPGAFRAAEIRHVSGYCTYVERKAGWAVCVELPSNRSPDGKRRHWDYL